MLYPIRRVISGHDAQGKSIIVSDEIVAPSFELEAWPGSGVTVPWSTSSAPASNGDEELGKAMNAFPDRGSGGVSFMIMQIPPMSDLEKMTPEQRAEATRPVAEFMPEGMNIDTSRSHHMHATETTDLLMLLKGEVTAIMEEGEVVLKPFDVLIQRGTNHSWENYGNEPALILSVIVDAKPLDRIRRPKPRENTPDRF